MLCASRTRAKRLAADLREQELSAFYSEDPDREVLPGETELFMDMWKRALNIRC